MEKWKEEYWDTFKNISMKSKKLENELLQNWNDLNNYKIDFIEAIIHYKRMENWEQKRKYLDKKFREVINEYDKFITKKVLEKESPDSSGMLWLRKHCILDNLNFFRSNLIDIKNVFEKTFQEKETKGETCRFFTISIFVSIFALIIAILPFVVGKLK